MGANSKIDQSKDLILFDGVCNLCNGAVKFVIKRDPGAIFQFASLQSSIARDILSRYEISSDKLDSIVLVRHSRLYVKSDAILEIAGDLSGFWAVLKVFRFLPKGLRDSAYDLIAGNRYKWFGKNDSCLIPTKELQYRFLDS